MCSTGRAASQRCSSRWLLHQLVVLLLATAASAGTSGKYACEYSNSLCQWQSSFAFGGTALGDKVFFHGGLLGNVPGTVNRSALEVLDLTSLAAFVIDTQPGVSSKLSSSSSNDGGGGGSGQDDGGLSGLIPLITTRYSHQLVTWGDKLLLLGGKFDNLGGSASEDNVILMFDFNNRTWSRFLLLGSEKDPHSARLFDAVAVAGDSLLAVLQFLDPADAGRSLMVMDLQSKKNRTIPLAVTKEPVELLRWQLVSLLPGTTTNPYPALVVHAKRTMSAATSDHITWFSVSGGAAATAQPAKAVPAIPCTASCSLRKVKGSLGPPAPQVLMMKLLRLQGRRSLVMLANTVASFANSSNRLGEVTIVLVHDVILDSDAKKSSAPTKVSLQLKHLLLTPPLRRSLSQLQSVDLPLHGHVAVGAAGDDKIIHLLPYVGKIDLISPQDNANTNIQETPEGFVIRGLGQADQACQRGADWMPFVIKVVANSQGDLVEVAAKSNYSWCSTLDSKMAAGKVVSDMASLATNGQVMRVNDDGDEGSLLMLVAPQTHPDAGLYPEFFPYSDAPLKGAYISLQNSRVDNFTIERDEGYKLPARTSSCVTRLNDKDVYVEAGGAFFDEGSQEYGLSAGAYTMDVQPASRKSHRLTLVAGSKNLRARAQAALACGPDGVVYKFGGLAMKSNPDGKKSVSDPTNDLQTIRLSRSRSSGSGSGSSTSAVSAAVLQLRASTKTWPTARSGHAMVYVDRNVGGKFKQGALLMYGGSGVQGLSLTALRGGDNPAALRETLDKATWDTSTWLFDIGAQAWSRLETTGPAPGRLMYHSMSVDDSQVILFGGQEFVRSEGTWPIRQSKDLYILDLGEYPLRWRNASVTNIRSSGLDVMAFPCISASSIPEQQAIALKYYKDLFVIPAAQTLRLQPKPDALEDWGLLTLNVSAGDWVRLVVPRSNRDVELPQPLILTGDVIFSGASMANGNSGGQGKRDAAMPVLRCKKGATTAISIRAAGVEVEDFVIRGCTGSAIEANFSAGGGASFVRLSNLTLTDNSGGSGSALWVGDGVGLRLHNCNIHDNSATGAVVHAGPGTTLLVINSTLRNNNGTALEFSGTDLTVEDCTFSGNGPTAHPAQTAAHKAELHSTTRSQETAAEILRSQMDEPGSAYDGGAVRILCQSQNTSCTANVTHTLFERNTGGAGGAILVGSRARATLTNCSFINNTANRLGGGAAFANRDACLWAVDCTFKDNRQKPGPGRQQKLYGGAVYMQNPSCDVLFDKSVFQSNSASNEGGALYIKDLTARGVLVQDCTFSKNEAYSGRGGAVALHSVSSKVNFNGSTFNGNTAREGGALYVHSFESAVSISNVSATANRARGQQQANSNSSPEDFNKFASHPGGALFFSSTDSELVLEDCNFRLNQAQGPGGAVYVTGSGGEPLESLAGVTVHIRPKCVFSDNSALKQGGALSLAQATLTMEAAQLLRNRVNPSTRAGAPLSAGGGLYCRACRLEVNDSLFELNSAAVGGGVAVDAVDDFKATSTSFVSNSALGASEGSSSSPATSAAASASPSADAAVSVRRYVGGGALYVGAAANCSLYNITLTNNTARIAGAVYLNLRGQNSSAYLSELWLQPPSTTAQQAAGGSSFLLDGPIAQVQMPGCKLTKASNDGLIAYATCVKLTMSGWQQGGQARRLLQDGGNSASYAGAPVAAAADAADLFGTTAVQLVLVQKTGEGRLDTRKDLQVKSNESLPELTLQLRDAMGQRVKGSISDASMPIVAKLFTRGATSRQQVVTIPMINNVTSGRDGTAAFRDLQIFPDRGTATNLELEFDSYKPLERPATLPLLTECVGCQVGEKTEYYQDQLANSSQAAECSTAFKCKPCQAPTFNFFIGATECSQCDSKSVCNQHYAIPRPGIYQSHPRNILFHDCLLPAACKRDQNKQDQLQNLADQLRSKKTSDVNDEDIAEWTGVMCVEGYSGPLCGACSPNFGRAGIGCARCLPPAVHRFLYILVGLVMLVWVSIQGWLHVLQVKRNHREHRQVAMSVLVSSMQSLSPQIAGPQLSMQPAMSHFSPRQGVQLSTALPSMQPQQQQLNGGYHHHHHHHHQSQQQQDHSQQQPPLQNGHSPQHQHQPQPRPQYLQLAQLRSFGRSSHKYSPTLAPVTNGDDVRRQSDNDDSSSSSSNSSWCSLESAEASPAQEEQQQQQQQQQHRAQLSVQMPWMVDPSESQPTDRGDSTTSHQPDSFTMASPWVVAGTTDPDVAIRLASDTSSPPASTSSSRPPAPQQGPVAPPGPFTAAELALMMQRGQLMGPAAAAAAAAQAAAHSPAQQPLQQPAPGPPAAAGAGNQHSQGLHAQGSTPASGGTGLRPSGSVSTGAGSIALQLKSMISGLFDTDVLHDAARTVRPAVIAFQQQQQQQQGQLQQQPSRQHKSTAAEHSWVADLFKLLTSHLQMLGLLRPLRIKWPDSLQRLLEHIDPSSALMAWARLECSLDEKPHLRRSVQRSIILLLSPVVAAFSVLMMWCMWVAYKAIRRQPLELRGNLLPHLVLYVVLILFFMYPQVSKEIVSTLSCHRVDNMDKFRAALPKSCNDNCIAEAVHAVQDTASYWSNDTRVTCFHGQHVAVLVLGCLGLLFFAVGLPVAVFVFVGSKYRQRLQEYVVELQLGVLYASYRRRYCWWEGVVLLEKLALVMVITLLQGLSVGLQVLMAISVVFISASLQVTFQPFACKLLDTLQRLSFYVLEITLFLLMVASFDDIADDRVRFVCLAVVGALNGFVLLVFACFIIRGLKRMLVGCWWRVANRPAVRQSRMRRGAQDWIGAVTGKYTDCFRVRKADRQAAAAGPVGGASPHAAAVGPSGHQR